MMSRLWKLCTLTLLALCLGGEARAQGLILPAPVPIPRPGPRPGGQPLSVRSQKIQMQLNDGVLKVEVEQVFQNPNAAPFEGTYLFPLPEVSKTKTTSLGWTSVEEASRLGASIMSR